MKCVYFLLVSLLINSAAYTQADINFQTTQGGYPTTALTHSYSAVGSPPTNVTVSVTGSTSALNNNSPQAFSNGLQLAVNHTSDLDCITTTLRFSPAVQGLTFKLFNIDRGAGSSPTFNYVDQVTVSGLTGATSATPIVSASGTSGIYSSISGTIITGTGNAPTAGSDPGNVVSFTGVVSEVTIQYCNDAAQTMSNPTGQAITIGSLFWDSVLPVHLISFQGKALGNQVALHWETSWEQNSDYFEVQRSRDAQEFSSVDRIAAVGESDSRHVYSLLDQEAPPGTSYYRLKQVDRGITPLVTYSPIIAVMLDDVIPSLELVGNPVDGGSIRIAYRNIEPQQLTLYTASGQAISCQITKESETRAILRPIQRLVPGLYVLRGTYRGNWLMTKIIAQ